MKDYFKQELKKPTQVTEFFNKLYKDGFLYHPEDDAHDIITSDDSKLFTDEEADILNQRMVEVWNVYGDPCEYVLNLMSKQ